MFFYYKQTQIVLQQVEMLQYMSSWKPLNCCFTNSTNTCLPCKGINSAKQERNRKKGGDLN